MKKVLTTAAFLLVIGASAAHAQAGLNLNWDGCSADAAVQDKTFLCNTNSGAAFAMFASIIVPTTMPKFAAASVIIDARFNDVALPAWWQTGTGACRANAVTMSFDPAVLVTTCPDLWAGSLNLGVFAVQTDGAIPNGTRWNGGAAIPAGSEIVVTADGTTELNVAKISINRTKTIATGSCAGCNIGGCIVFNESWVQQPDPMPTYRVTNESSRRFVTWQGGGLDCATVPAVNRTWGAVKNLYR